MILNVSLVTLYCLDQSAARDFYVQNLGFEPRTDVTMGEGFRWVTIGHPSQPELEVTLMVPGPPLSPEAADFVRGVVEGRGLDDRRGPLGGIARLEDARADEHALRAELHHHGGVRGGGDAAGGEQHDRQLARRGD